VNPFGQCGDDLQKWLNAKAADYVREHGPGGRFPEDPEFAENTLTHVRKIARFFWIGDHPRISREDFASIIMERAIRYFGSFSGEGEFTAWLYGIARTRATTQRRWASIESKVQPLDSEKPDKIEAQVRKHQGQLDTAELSEITDQIWIKEVLANLPPRMARVVRGILNGESPEEIGRDLKLKPASVRSTYHRAVLKLGEIQPRRLGAKSERPPGGPRARRGTG